MNRWIRWVDGDALPVILGYAIGALVAVCVVAQIVIRVTA